MNAEQVRLECLREAVRFCMAPATEEKDPLVLAKNFAGFVFGFAWNEDDGEFVEPEADDTSLAAVRAFNDEGEEL